MFIIFYLAYALIIGTFAIDGILPVMDIIGAYFGIAAEDKIQLMISLYFLSLGIGQCFLGILSDIFGRKKIIIGSVVFFLLSLLLSLLSENYTVFIISRILQGFCASFGQVLSKAILVDLYRGDVISQKLASVIAIFSLGPMLAPFIGVCFEHVFGWQSIFIFLIINLIVYLLITIFFFQETLSKENKKQFSMLYFQEGLKNIFTNYQSVYLIFIHALGYTILLLFLSNLPIIYTKHFEMERHEFAILMAIINFSMIFGQLLNKKMIKKFNSFFALKMAILMQFATALSAFLFIDEMTILLFSIHLFFFSFSFVAIASNSAALAIMPQRSFCGLCSSLQGSISFLFSGLILSFVLNPFINGSFNQFIWVYLMLGSILMISLIFLKKEKIVSEICCP